jgi:hypothetical protein
MLRRIGGDDKIMMEESGQRNVYDKLLVWHPELELV